MTVLGIAIATVVAFVVSLTYYSVMPAASPGADSDRTPSQERPAVWQVLVELVRSAAVAGLLTGLLHAAGWDGPGTGVALGLALWSLPVVLLAGSVLWEGVHARAAVLHSGDWLIKLAVIGAIVGFFA